mgnify:CR=1 FL=1|tara:strand:- start:21193 stop:21750 length:558 start_codon:yes stop_codon:yes gene_type:complete
MSTISSHRNTLPIDRINTPVIKPTKQSTQGQNPFQVANPETKPKDNPGTDPTKFQITPDIIKPPSEHAGELWQSDTTTQLRSIIANAKQGAQAELTPETEARVAAEGLVSSTFIEPILKQIRESNTAPPPFGPSSAEKQFASLLDTNIADEIVHAANFPLVERIANQLMKNMPQVQPQQSIDIQG